MAPRSKKEDTGSGELMVSIEQYTRTRDTVCFLLAILSFACIDALASCCRDTRARTRVRVARHAIQFYQLHMCITVVALTTRSRSAAFPEQPVCVGFGCENGCDWSRTHNGTRIRCHACQHTTQARHFPHSS
jgi:hypothetical protein